MSPDRLVTAIKQEMLRNKKKSAILGVMCLVAAYFWVPLVWGWIFPDDTGEDSLESAAPADFVVASPAPAEAASPETAPPPRRRRSIPWEELLRRIQEDPRMAPAELPTLARSPFTAPAAEAPSPAVVEADPPSASAAVERPQVAELQLELTGIVYGPRVRIATINGTEYHENDRLRVAAAEQDGAESITSEVQTPDADADEPDDTTAPRSAAERYARGEITLAELLQLQAGETSGDPPTTRDEDSASVDSQGMAASPAPEGESAAELICQVAAIHPHYVVLQFDDGTTRELRLGGARVGAGDVIQVSKRNRLP